MVGWHHWINGHEFEQTLGDSGGQWSLTGCSPWGHKEWDMTEQLDECQWNLNTGERYPCQSVPMKGSMYPILFLSSLLSVEMQTSVGHLDQMGQTSGLGVTEQKDRRSPGPQQLHGPKLLYQLSCS